MNDMKKTRNAWISVYCPVHHQDWRPVVAVSRFAIYAGDDPVPYFAVQYRCVKCRRDARTHRKDEAIVRQKAKPTCNPYFPERAKSVPA